jgi:hypothetical protein
MTTVASSTDCLHQLQAPFARVPAKIRLPGTLRLGAMLADLVAACFALVSGVQQPSRRTPDSISWGEMSPSCCFWWRFPRIHMLVEPGVDVIHPTLPSRHLG